MRGFLVVMAFAGCGRINFDPRSDATDDAADDAIGNVCIAELAALGTSVLARRGDGSVWSWGGNTAGELGRGQFSPFESPGPSMMTRAIALAPGELHTCAIDADRRLFCWGQGVNGQLGQGGTSAGPSPSPLPVTLLPAPVVEARASEFNTCARLTDGTGWCWGHNQNAQLGFVGPASNAPLRVPALDNATTFTTGDNFVCVLRPNQTVECWGKNDEGELGDGTNAPPSRETAAPIIAVTDPVKQVRAGCHRHTCVVTTGGDVWCWGENMNGQVDSANISPFIATPLRVQGIPPGAVQVAVGAFHSCARYPTHEIWCWGRNASAELGIGTTGLELAPVRTQFTGIALDLHASCGGTAVLTPDGIVVWGDQVMAGMQPGSGVLAPTPVDVPCP